MTRFVCRSPSPRKAWQRFAGRIFVRGLASRRRCSFARPASTASARRERRRAWIRDGSGLQDKCLTRTDMVAPDTTQQNRVVLWCCKGSLREHLL